MHSIEDICNETGLSVDDVRLILADHRADWAITNEVSEAEYQLISQSARAALPGK